MSERVGQLFKRHRNWTGTLVVALIFLLLPVTSDNAYQVGLFTAAAINLLLLLGLNVISGYGGQFSLGQVAFEGVGAYFATLGSLKLGMSPAVAFLLAPLATVVIAVLVGIPSLRLRGMYFAMATLGVGLVFVLLVNDDINLTGGPNGIGPPPTLSVFGMQIASPNAIYWMSAVFAFLGLIVVQIFVGSRMGWSLKAARASEPAAATVGINTFRVRIIAFALSGALAGLAGAIEAFYSGYVTPDSFTWGSSVLLVVALVIGGMGTFLGPLIGTFILYVFSNWLTSLDNWEPVILGVIFLVCLRVFPGGIAASIANLLDRIRASRAGPAEALPSVPVAEQATTVAGGGTR